MSAEETVFEKHYRFYLEQLGGLSLKNTADAVGAVVEGDALRIVFFGRTYTVSGDGIADPFGRRPPYDCCVILSRYLLSRPNTSAAEGSWMSFRDFKDAAPLTGFFANDVEGAISSHFSGKLDALQRASDALGGTDAGIEARYDLVSRFTALPKVSLLLLFNDEDEGFAPTSSVLFEACTEAYLDAECIAMLGSQLFRHLKAAALGHSHT